MQLAPRALTSQQAAFTARLVRAGRMFLTEPHGSLTGRGCFRLQPRREKVAGGQGQGWALQVDKSKRYVKGSVVTRPSLVSKTLAFES